MTDISQYKNYRFDEKKKILFRVLENKQQLLWRLGGVPCFTASVWNEFKGKAEKLGYKLGDKKFICDADDFDLFKQEIRDVELQYAVDEYFWCETK